MNKPFIGDSFGRDLTEGGSRLLDIAGHSIDSRDVNGRKDCNWAFKMKRTLFWIQ
jgi:hypothetical protein